VPKGKRKREPILFGTVLAWRGVIGLLHCLISPRERVLTANPHEIARTALCFPLYFFLFLLGRLDRQENPAKMSVLFSVFLVLPASADWISPRKGEQLPGEQAAGAGWLPGREELPCGLWLF